MIILSQTLPQFIMIIGNYVVVNAAVPVLSNVNSASSDAIIYYLLKKINIIAAAIVLIVSFLLLVRHLNDASIGGDSLLGAGGGLLTGLLLIHVFSINGVVSSVVLMANLRSNDLDVDLEKLMLLAQIISLVGFVFFLMRNEVLLANVFLALRYILLSIFLWIKSKLFFPQDVDEVALKKITDQAKILLYGSVFFKSTIVFERLILAGLSSGSLAILVFVQQIYSAYEQIVNRVVVAPSIRGNAIIIEEKQFSIIYKKAKSVIVWLMTGSVLAFSIMLAVIPVVFDVFFIGSGVEESQKDVIWLLSALLFGQVCFSGAANYMNSVFYASQFSKLPVAIGVVSTAIGLGLRYYLSEVYEVNGVAAAISIQYTIGFGLLVVSFVIYMKMKSGRVLC